MSDVDFGAYLLAGNTYTVAGDQQYPGNVLVDSSFSGELRTAGAGGTVTLQFAQQNSDPPTPTTLKLGSWMRLFPVA